jgi:hypothetical protein
VSNNEYGHWIIERVSESGKWERIPDTPAWLDPDDARREARDYATAQGGLLYGINFRVRQLGYDPCGQPAGRMT